MLVFMMAVRGLSPSPVSLPLQLRGGFGVGMRAFESYTGLLATAPLATNCVSAACLGMLSDGIAQSLTPCVRTWDSERTAGMSVWGAAVSGGVIFFWLQLLSRLFPNARTSTAQLVSKVFVNQLVMSPGLNGGFFAFVILTRTAPRMRMNASKRSQLVEKYRRDLLPTITRSCLFWSVVQGEPNLTLILTFTHYSPDPSPNLEGVNFKLIAPQFGVLWTNAAFVLWTTYLSLVANRVRE